MERNRKIPVGMGNCKAKAGIPLSRGFQFSSEYHTWTKRVVWRRMIAIETKACSS
jgi:hypothetical protein